MARIAVKSCKKCKSASNKLEAYYSNVYSQEKKDITSAIDTLKNAKNVDFKTKYREYITKSVANH